MLARLGYELLGDASAGPRRRSLVDEALRLARGCGDPRTVAEVLDARLHALWDPAAADDRLAAASEIVELARASHDDDAERRGLFWRFVALMELGQVTAAESALAAFARAAEAAGDGAASVMVTSRHGMLAVLRGRFDQTTRLIDEVASAGRRAGLADTDRLVEALRGAINAEQGPAVPQRRQPSMILTTDPQLFGTSQEPCPRRRLLWPRVDALAPAAGTPTMHLTCH